MLLRSASQPVCVYSAKSPADPGSCPKRLPAADGCSQREGGPSTSSMVRPFADRKYRTGTTGLLGRVPLRHAMLCRVGLMRPASFFFVRR